MAVESARPLGFASAVGIAGAPEMAARLRWGIRNDRSSLFAFARVADVDDQARSEGRGGALDRVA